MPLALLKVPTLVLVLKTTLSAEMRAVGVENTTLPLGGELAGLDVHHQVVGEELLAGVGGAGFALDLDLALQPDVVGVDALEDELLGVPAGQALRAGVAGRQQRGKRARQQDESNTHGIRSRIPAFSAFCAFQPGPLRRQSAA